MLSVVSEDSGPVMFFSQLTEVCLADRNCFSILISVLELF